MKTHLHRYVPRDTSGSKYPLVVELWKSIVKTKTGHNFYLSHRRYCTTKTQADKIVERGNDRLQKQGQLFKF